MIIQLTYSVLALCLFSSSQAKMKPKDVFKLCKRSDPELEKCLINSANEAEHAIVRGHPQLKIAPFEPLFIPRMTFNQGQNNFKLNMVLTNLTTNGASTSVIKSVKVDKNFNWMNFTSFTKHIHMESEYLMDGQILVLPVKGSGHVTFDFDNTTLEANINFEYFNKKGERYMRSKQIVFGIYPQKVRSYFTNLFNGDKALGDSTNKFFNDNWRDVYVTYKELPERAFGEFFKEYFNRVLVSYPVKDWFLD